MDHHLLLAIVATGAAFLSGGAMLFFGMRVRASDRRIEALEHELARTEPASRTKG